MPGLFEIDHDDVKRLNAVQLTELLRRLLYLEARARGIPASCVSVSLRINVADGGEDARIEWRGKPEPKDTVWIPSRLTLFQCKATDMAPMDCKEEVLRKQPKKGKASTEQPKLKPTVEEVLDAGGSYVIFVNRGYNRGLRRSRVKRVREALRECGKSYAASADMRVYDACDSICPWVNSHVSAIVHVRRLVGRAMPAGLQTWQGWEGYRDHSQFAYVADDELQGYIEEVRQYISQPKRVLRVVGLSGIGKTRLALESFRPPKDPDDIMHNGL